jgi:hypothetical protein
MTATSNNCAATTGAATAGAATIGATGATATGATTTPVRMKIAAWALVNGVAANALRTVRESPSS